MIANICDVKNDDPDGTLWGWGWIFVFLKWQKLFMAYILLLLLFFKEIQLLKKLHTKLIVSHTGQDNILLRHLGNRFGDN